MGFLERAIRRGVSDAVGKAIGKAIEPTVTDLTNKAANAIDQAAQNTEQQVARSSGLEGAMANLERSVQGYATEAAKNMKVCPNCNKPTTADKKFCPDCGTQLPEQTVAQGAVCPSCGKQNAIGTKFCGFAKSFSGRKLKAIGENTYFEVHFCFLPFLGVGLCCFCCETAKSIRRALKSTLTT